MELYHGNNLREVKNMTDLILKTQKDLYDAYSLGHESIDWLAVLVGQIKNEVDHVTNKLVQQGVCKDSFKTLNILLTTVDFISEEQINLFEAIKAQLKESNRGTVLNFV